MTLAALLLYLAGLAVVFGVRTWLHRRRTGSSGFHGISGTRGSLRWWAGVLFLLAIALGAAAPALALAGVVPAPGSSAAGRSATDVVAVAGLLLVLLGFAWALAAQTGMGTSWRIGVEETERTTLVTQGVFAVARNPFFAAMVVAQAGVTLMVPTWVSLAALGCLVAAVQLQVRLIEEPYLVATHGAAYRDYATRTGRFVPKVGRRRPSTPAVKQ